MLQPDEIPRGILSDIAEDVRRAIDQASQRLLLSAKEYEYVFPWRLTATDADDEIVFTRQYTQEPVDGLRVDEVVSSPAKALPRFPVAFRLVDDIGQDITWSIGVAVTREE
jgi:hypothetical protein